jgi:hypothetical protein
MLLIQGSSKERIKSNFLGSNEFDSFERPHFLTYILHLSSLASVTQRQLMPAAASDTRIIGNNWSVASKDLS